MRPQQHDNRGSCAWGSFSPCAVVCLVVQSVWLLWTKGCSPPGSSVHEDSPGKNTGVGCHALLQGIFPAQGSNPPLPHCRWIFYHLIHQGSPRILQWVVCPFSRRTSRPRNQTRVLHIANRFFTSGVTQEAHHFTLEKAKIIKKKKKT